MQDRFRFRLWDDDFQCYYGSTKEGYLEFDIEKVIDGPNENDKEILEQCTGLHDANGNLIYEGDILEDRGKRVIVKWVYNTAQFALYDPNTQVFEGGICDFLYDNSPYKIIGNIHENTALLEEK